MSTTTPSTEGEMAAADRDVVRGEFLVRAAAGGGFMVGCMLPGIGHSAGADVQAPEALREATAPATAWITVGSDERVTIRVPMPEMAHGTLTSLAKVVADELRVDRSRISVEFAPVATALGATNASPWGRFTEDGTGIHLLSPEMRHAAADARQLLVMAAARHWSVQADSCTAHRGSVTRGPKSLSYGFLAPIAAGLALPGTAALDPHAQASVETSRRLDTTAGANGSVLRGMDAPMPGMVFAAVKHCPTIGGTVEAVGSTPPGALAVVEVGATAGSGPTGVAVIAATTWDAMQAARRLNVDWNEPGDPARRDTKAINALAAWLMSYGKAMTAQSRNPKNLAAGLAPPNVAIASTYQLPYLAHRSMDPMNCTARYTPAAGTAPACCEVWAPTQAPGAALQTVKALCPAGTEVDVVNTLVGGGFERRFEQDFVREAVQVALACPGKHVRLTWLREEDFSDDRFCPLALSSIQAAVSPATGKITAWSNRIVTPPIGTARAADLNALDRSAVDGAIHLPYALDPILVEHVRHDAAIPVGYWRSVGVSINTFAVECAIDELATAIGRDPIMFRLNNLADARMIGVLDALRALSDWRSAPAAGRARGVAIASGFGSHVGQVAEISVNPSTGAVAVHRVSSVIDCGVAIDPDAIRAQVESAVTQAIAATLWAQQNFVEGEPQGTGLAGQRALRMQAMPQLDVRIIANGDPAGGVGEPCIPCVAPAIANACARLMGPVARKRALPFFCGSTLGDL